MRIRLPYQDGIYSNEIAPASIKVHLWLMSEILCLSELTSKDGQ